MDKDSSTFEYLDSINKTKEDLMTPETEEWYQPYLINHFLSATCLPNEFPDTLKFAAFLNRMPFLDKRMHYDFLRIAVKKKYRRSKWLKVENKTHIKMLQKYYECSFKKAKEALQVLTAEQLQEIENSMAN